MNCPICNNEIILYDILKHETCDKEVLSVIKECDNLYEKVNDIYVLYKEEENNELPIEKFSFFRCKKCEDPFCGGLKECWENFCGTTQFC